ncbi:MAG: PhzF family phenazine biosynthesis protein [Firmicutes bacterium]|nr:PhzF family phenazine biosynthesis protein [Bacillota bacterium]
MEIILYQVDAFTDKPFRGNPAGVIPDAKGITEREMQNIAKELNLSETAFVIKKKDDLYSVRFFTPVCEVNLCGHATIATFYTLASKGYIGDIENGIVKVYQETNVGILPVEIYFKDGDIEKIMMQQKPPESLREIENNTKDIIADILNIDSDDIGLNGYSIEPEIISTGLSDIILPVKNKEVLKSIKIDIQELIKLSNSLNVTGIHAFTVDNKEVHCRNFAPAVGIEEESATGTSNGALIYKLYKHDIIQDNMRAYQGESLGRISEIQCEILKDDKEMKVKVGGKACIVIEGVIHI